MLEFVLGICIGIPLGGYLVIFLMKWKMKKMMKQLSQGDMSELMNLIPKNMKGDEEE